MTTSGSEREHEIPANWDVIAEAPPADDDGGDAPIAKPAPPEVPTLNLVAASWGDGVSIVGVATGALLALSVAGFHPGLPALSWAAGLGLAWWLFAASVLIRVRLGTPGMLLAGVCFDSAVAPRRIGLVVVAAAVSAVLVGLPGALGPNRSLLAAGSGRALKPIPVD